MVMYSIIILIFWLSAIVFPLFLTPNTRREEHTEKLNHEKGHFLRG